jgi:hypothetical protein
MRKLKTILVTCVVASSLFAAAGTAWGTTATLHRGTSWTNFGEAITVDDPIGGPIGISWESLGF